MRTHDETIKILGVEIEIHINVKTTRTKVKTEYEARIIRKGMSNLSGYGSNKKNAIGKLFIRNYSAMIDRGNRFIF